MIKYDIGQVNTAETSKAAKKILAVEDISPDSLKDIPYEMLAKEF